jgi:hypothetical protein
LKWYLPLDPSRFPPFPSTAPGWALAAGQKDEIKERAKKRAVKIDLHPLSRFFFAPMPIIASP